MTVATWLAAALADAERRGLPELKPLIEMLGRSTEALRAADRALLEAGAPPDPPQKL